MEAEAKGKEMRKIILTDGTETDIGPQKIDSINRLIGSDTLDTVLLRDRIHVMLVDDNGIAKGLPINQKATDLYWERCGGPTNNHIHGDVVIVPDEDFA